MQRPDRDDRDANEHGCQTRPLCDSGGAIYEAIRAPDERHQSHRNHRRVPQHDMLSYSVRLVGKWAKRRSGIIACEGVLSVRRESIITSRKTV